MNVHNELLRALLWIDSFAGERIRRVHLLDEGCVQLAKAEKENARIILV